MKIRYYYPELIGAVGCLILGILSGYSVKAGNSLWYLHLNKPVFNPPSWIFGPIWSLLYCMMGIGLGKLWKNKNQNLLSLRIFALQFLCNLIWSPLFFYFQRIDLALLDISLLWILLVIFIAREQQRKGFLILFIPYFMWVTFAGLLNFCLYKMNPL